jgi:hypothetical protein
MDGDVMSFGKQFLSCPDLFPARLAGEPWGKRSMAIDFLGKRYLVTGLDEEQADAIHAHFGPYCLESDSTISPEVEIRIYRADEEDFSAFDLRGWDYSLDMDYRLESVRVAGLDFMGLLECRRDLVGAIWTSARDADGFSGVFENFLRVTAQYHLVASGGVLLHSAALVVEGSAYLFPGRSGAGKSTLCRLARTAGWQILSDELNAVSIREGCAYLRQVPFAGDFGRTSCSHKSFPLAAIFRLCQAEDDTVQPISPAQSLGSMLSCAPFVNLDPHRYEKAATALEEIASSHPGFTLSFSLGGSLRALERFCSRAEVLTL